MPATPLHVLALLFLYFKDKKRIDLLALVVSVAFVDLEPLYYLLIGEALDHRIWHSFLASLTGYSFLITLGVHIVERVFEERLWFAYRAFRLKPDRVKYPLSRIYLCSLIGSLSHIFLDMLTHKAMPYVIYPLFIGNPFYNESASITVEIAVILLAIYSCLTWLKERA